MKRKTKEAWLKEGMKVLAENGAAGLTIDVLLKRLGVTKGSFYHHFKNRQAFNEELLKFWEKEMTMDIIRLSEKGKTPEEKLRRLIDLCTTLPITNLEVAIRAWALRDPLVRDYQERVDCHRLEYCQELFVPLIKEGDKARIWGQLLYSVYVGAQQMVPSIQGKDLKRIYDELEKSIGFLEV